MGRKKLLSLENNFFSLCSSKWAGNTLRLCVFLFKSWGERWAVLCLAVQALALVCLPQWVRKREIKDDDDELYSAFPYRYRIRFSCFSTEKTGQGIKQHFLMWELIKWERLSRGLCWGREFGTGRQTQWSCWRLGNKLPWGRREQARSAVQQRCHGCSHWRVPRSWGEAGLVLRHSRAASHSCCLKRVEGGRINVQGENSGCGVFPVLLGLRFLFILGGSGSTLLFLAAGLTLQAVWRGSSSRGAGGWQRSISCAVELSLFDISL